MAKAKEENEGRLIAEARDKFFKNNIELLVDIGATGQYLKNRLERAFIAGWEAARENQRRVDYF